MKIAIDSHVSKGIFQGTRTSLENILPFMIDNNPDIHFSLIGYKTGSNDFNRNNCTIIKSPFKSGKLNYLFGFGFQCRKLGIDLFHSQYFIPFLTGKTRTIATLHDVLFLDFPDYFPVAHRTLQKNALMHTINNADCIIADSNYTKNRLLFFGVNSKKNIIVIPNGVNASFFSGKSIPPPFPLPEEYILYVGRIAPIKNIQSLVNAFSILKSGIFKSRQIKLIICGNVDPAFCTDNILVQYNNWKKMDDVIVLEGLDNSVIRHLYQNTKCFAFPSFGEGFGLPVLEAMASGAPVVASNSTSIPEVAGDAALLFDPANVNSIANAIAEIVQNKNIADDFREKGLKRVALFSWEEYAKHLVEVYRQFS